MPEEININGWAADVARLEKQAHAYKADADVVSSSALPMAITLEHAGTVTPEVAVPVVPEATVEEVPAPVIPVPAAPSVPSVPTVPKLA